jgi:hypothetical protein
VRTAAQERTVAGLTVDRTLLVPHPSAMATKKKDAKPDSTEAPSEPDRPNRDQRRRAKFGRAGGVAKEAWPQSEANPAFGHLDHDSAAHTGNPDQDATHQTGAGTGGATEGNNRIVEREEIHGSNAQKS